MKILTWGKNSVSNKNILEFMIKEHTEAESIWYYEHVKAYILFSFQHLPRAHVCT